MRFANRKASRDQPNPVGTPFSRAVTARRRPGPHGVRLRTLVKRESMEAQGSVLSPIQARSTIEAISAHSDRPDGVGVSGSTPLRCMTLGSLQHA